MNWWQKERKAAKEKKEMVRLDILISQEKGTLQVRASLVAGADSSQAYKEPIRAVEIVHSVCQKLIAIDREPGENGARSVLSCGCGMKLEFPRESIVNTVGDLDRELKRQDKERNLKNKKD